MKITLKNGVVVKAPEDMTVVVSTAMTKKDKADGVIRGDNSIAGSLILAAIQTFLSNQDKGHREAFVIAAMRILALGEDIEEDSDE